MLLNTPTGPFHTSPQLNPKPLSLNSIQCPVSVRWALSTGDGCVRFVPLPAFELWVYGVRRQGLGGFVFWVWRLACLQFLWWSLWCYWFRLIPLIANGVCVCCCQESRVSYSTLRIICNMEGLNISHPLATRLMSLALMMHGRPTDGETSRDRNIMRALCRDQNCTSLID